MIRLLAIGNDPTIALPAAEAMGDTHQRQLQYASILERYHLITRAPSPLSPLMKGGRGGSSIRLSENFWVHPCGPHSMAEYVVAAVRTGWRIAREEAINVVSTQDPFLTGWVGYLIARRLGLPLSLQFAADMVDNSFWLREKPANTFLNRLAHWLIPKASTFRVVSERERYKLLHLGIPDDRIWNLGWITDFSRFLQADGRALRSALLTRHSPPATHLVLYVGRLVSQKDIPTLFRAFAAVTAELPRALLVLVGRGPLEPALRGQAVEVRLSSSNCHFAGMVPYEQIPAYFAAADVFVLSSVYEGNARVLAEAAASAKPVVSTDVSGASDTIVNGKTGFIVPVQDYQAMAERLKELLSHPERAAEMGQAGRRHILTLYHPERLLAGFRELWETTASMKRKVSRSPLLPGERPEVG